MYSSGLLVLVIVSLCQVVIFNSPSLLIRAHVDESTTYSMMPEASQFGLIYRDRDRANCGTGTQTSLPTTDFPQGMAGR